VDVLASKYRIPVYVTGNTLLNCRFNIDQDLIRYFKAHEEINVGELSVVGFPKLHDANDPHSFYVKLGKIKVAVLTDIGKPCVNVVNSLADCNAAFLEANYDEQLLETGNYPAYLKKRIRSNVGHLSNTQALELFLKTRGPQLTHLILAHLSKENNCPILVKDLFESKAENTRVVVASRDRESEVFEITGKYVKVGQLNIFEEA
jgi:phosphoribosyl 1,2-cyclic phosphodiesterase